MNNKQLTSELRYYNRAYKNNNDRRELHFGNWPHLPSKPVSNLLERNNLHKLKKVRVLDLGCGDGRHINYFRGLGFEVVGVDFSREAIKVCTERFYNDSGVDLFVKNVLKKNFTKGLGEYDLVLDWSVFDHQRANDISKYLKNVLPVLKNGGYFIISVFDKKNPDFYKNRSYMVCDGIYYKGYTIDEITGIFKPLQRIDYEKRKLEDSSSRYHFNTILFKKSDI